jgi:hypothetical protein
LELELVGSDHFGVIITNPKLLLNVLRIIIVEFLFIKYCKHSNGTTTLSKMTLSIMTLNITLLSMPTLIKMPPILKTLRIMIISIAIVGINYAHNDTLVNDIKHTDAEYDTTKQNDTQHNATKLYDTQNNDN